MNSKERVMTALNHEKPDRCPINFRATQKVIDRLCEKYDKDYFALLEYYNVDFREVIPEYVGPEFKKLDDGTEIDYWGVGRKELITEHSRDVYVNHSPLSGVKDIDDVLAHDWPSVDMFDFSEIENTCDKFENYGISTPGIHAEGYHGVFHQLTYLFGMEEAMMNMVTDEELVQETIQQIMRFLTDYYEKLFQEAKGKIDFLFYKDDFGAQDNLLISKEMFIKYFAPTIKKLVDLANDYGAKLILHSCGSVIKLIPDFIDLGVEILDPIQTSADGMDIDVLQKRFGDNLTFHGGIDTQKDLPNYSPEQVEDLVKRTIDTLGEGGGYFFSPSHRIQEDTSLENIKAMYNTAKNYSY